MERATAGLKAAKTANAISPLACRSNPTPLLNTKGEGVGIVVAQMQGMQNINYAVKVSELYPMLEALPNPGAGAVLPGQGGEAHEIVERVQPSVVIVGIE